MARAAVGGTFDVLHRGHHALLDAAFVEGDEGVSIGVTTDAFANARRQRRVRPWQERVADLAAYLQSQGLLESSTILPLNEPFGSGLEPAYDLIVVTDETARTARRLNERRVAAGVHPLRIVVVARVRAADGEPISATRVLRGEIDANGWLKPGTPVHQKGPGGAPVDALEEGEQESFPASDVPAYSDPTQHRGPPATAARNARMAPSGS